MERALGLMCGAGALPARMAAEARRQGWRVIAFTFDGAGDPGGHAHRTVPARMTALGPVLSELQAEKVAGVVFSGKFWMGDLLKADAGDAVHARMSREAGALIDANLTAVVVSTLGSLGIELLDQRAFLGDTLAGEGCWTRRAPSDAEWADVRRGFEVARLAADASVGQTVVVRRGVVSAVEAIEGTTETIRRGTSLGGPGAVVVKAVASTHDYRFDTPTIGPDTVEAAAAGGVAVMAVEAGRVLIVEREVVAQRADAAGLALVSTHGR